MCNKNKQTKIDRVCSIIEIGYEECYDISNNENDFFNNEPNFFVDDVLVHNCGTHAGGVVITPKPLYNYIPVDRVNGEIITAFPESGSESILESMGIVKIDILGISILDVIEQTIEMISEKLYLIIDNDGLTKVVPESYLNKEIAKF